MRAIDELINEHHGIQMMLSALHVLAEKLRAGERLEYAHLERMMEFFTVFVDACHHGKEEAYLFPAMEAAGVAREGGPIGVLLHEHARGRELVAAMKKALHLVQDGDPAGAASFPLRAEEYRTLLLAHIEKENTVFFPLAAARLGEGKDGELFEAFARLEEERIGKGTHEQFHAFLERMLRLYVR